MFEITIKGDSLAELASSVLALAGQFQTTEAPQDGPNTFPAVAKVKAKLTKAAPEPVSEAYVPDAADAEIPDPLPETAKAIVDAGTGQPITEQPKQMTVDDVRSAAAKLAAADSPRLATILKSYGAGKLSEVPNGKLGDFAGDVMEALG